MFNEELIEKIKGLEDKALAVEILEASTGLTTSMAEKDELIEAAKRKVADLQDQNNKLFIKITTDTTKEDEAPKNDAGIKSLIEEYSKS